MIDVKTSDLDSGTLGAGAHLYEAREAFFVLDHERDDVLALELAELVRRSIRLAYVVFDVLGSIVLLERFSKNLFGNVCERRGIRRRRAPDVKLSHSWQ